MAEEEEQAQQQQQRGLMALQVVLNHLVFTPSQIDQFVRGFTDDQKLKLFLKLEWAKDEILRKRIKRFKDAKNTVRHPDWSWETKTNATLNTQYALRIAYGAWTNEVNEYGSRLLHDEHTVLNKLTEAEVDLLLACSATTIEAKIQKLKRRHQKQVKRLVEAWSTDTHVDWVLRYQQPYLQFELNVSSGRCHIDVFYKSTSDTPYHVYIEPWHYPNGIETSRLEYVTDAQAKLLLRQSKRHVRPMMRRLFGPGKKRVADLTLGELEKNRGAHPDVDVRLAKVERANDV